MPYVLRQTGSEVQTALDTVSTNTTSITSLSQAISSKANKSYVDLGLAGKVDKVANKGLTSNDFSDADKLKLDGIQAGAQVNINADWNASSGAAKILNKPDLSDYVLTSQMDVAISIATANKVDKEAGKGLSTNDYSNADKAKLAGIAQGAEVNVLADWNAVAGDALILNKPNLSIYITRDEVESMIGGISSIEYVPVDSLPTASSSTMNKIYIVPISGSSNNAQWMTEKNGNTYTWKQIGTTAVDVANAVYLGDVVENNVTIAS